MFCDVKPRALLVTVHKAHVTRAVAAVAHVAHGTLAHVQLGRVHGTQARLVLSARARVAGILYKYHRQRMPYSLSDFVVHMHFLKNNLFMKASSNKRSAKRIHVLWVFCMKCNYK